MPELKDKGENIDHRDRQLYRSRVQAPDLIAFEVVIKETDLMIMAEGDLTSETRDLVLTHRHRLEEYIARHPEFLTSLDPLFCSEGAPSIVALMTDASRTAGVGPMAAVAGAVSEMVGEGLRKYSQELIVENGGDVYLAGRRERTIAVYTGEETLASRIGLKLPPDERPLGICTSSGRFGHSLSLGDASTATVVAKSAALADAAATAVGNRVRGPDGIEKGMEFARQVPGIIGAVIVHAGKFGAWGGVELVTLDGERESR